MEPNSSKKTLWIVIAIVVVAIIAWWMLASDKVAAPVSDTTADASDISAELSGLNEADLNAEFQDVDKDLEQL